VNKSEGTCEVPQNVWVQEIQKRYASELGLLVREEGTVESVVVKRISNNSMWEEGEALLK
jgi:hypothetical protein